MAVADLTGPLIVTVRDDAGVAAITPRVRGGELAPGDVAPAVVIIRASNSRAPFGRGTARLGLQQPRFYATCYGTNFIQLEQLMGAVSDALHLKRNRVISNKTIRLVTDEGWGGPVVDPATKWPTDSIVFEVTGHA